MVEGPALGRGDRGGFPARPHRLGPALQQEHVFVRWQVARNGPLDVLRAAVMTFDAPCDINQRLNFVVAEASDILLIGGHFFIHHAGTTGIWPVLAYLGGNRAAGDLARHLADDVFIRRDFPAGDG